jgi:glycerol-3-phosphate acyltransferase PlsY
MVALFLILAYAFRYVSLASVAVAAAFPLLAWAFKEYADSRQLVLIALVSALVIWKHRQNIRRISAGKESKLGKKSESNLTTTSAPDPNDKSVKMGVTRQ